jgi:hypothetical protein
MGVVLHEDVRNHAKVVARAWADPDFKDALLAEPKTVLRDYGFDFAGAAEVRVIDASEMTIEAEGATVYFGIPAAPEGGLGDEALTSGLRASNCACDFCPGSHTAHTTHTTNSVDCANCTDGVPCGVAP